MALESARAKLEGKFAFENLPADRSATALWAEIRADYKLTLEELSALQNERCKPHQGSKKRTFSSSSLGDLQLEAGQRDSVSSTDSAHDLPDNGVLVTVHFGETLKFQCGNIAKFHHEGKEICVAISTLHGLIDDESEKLVGLDQIQLTHRSMDEDRRPVDLRWSELFLFSEDLSEAKNDVIVFVLDPVQMQRLDLPPLVPIKAVSLIGRRLTGRSLLMPGDEAESVPLCVSGTGFSVAGTAQSDCAKLLCDAAPFGASGLCLLDTKSRVVALVQGTVPGFEIDDPKQTIVLCSKRICALITAPLIKKRK